MSDDLLDRYGVVRAFAADAAESGADTEPAEANGAFGLLRGIRDRAVMLELRKKEGSILAIGYSWLERVEYDPSAGITLCFQGRQVRLKGRNLNAPGRAGARLFQSIARHRVPWVQESDRARSIESGRDDVVIENIDWSQ